jgi:transposase InsO family protein
MMLVNQYKPQAQLRDLCHWTMLPRSLYYYKPTGGAKGIRPSSHTPRQDGTLVPNDLVVEDIKAILSGDFVCYGYHKVTMELRQMNYIINPKKVYRLMDQNHLLLGKVIKTQGKRTWVKHRKIEAKKPLEYLCLDIKYVWIEGEKRFYYLLTVLDVYTRKVMGWILQRSIKQMDVIRLLRKLDLEHSLKGVNVRNDNGSQFIAHRVRFFLRSSEANQEFTHIATPEENAYIEAYHSIYEREVIQRFELSSYYEASLTTTAYNDFYNNRRLHGGIGYKTPQKMWDDYFAAKANTANFGNLIENEQGIVLNSFDKNVQFIGG